MTAWQEFRKDFVRLIPFGMFMSFAGRAAYALTLPAGSVDPTASITNLGGKGVLIGGGTLCIISIYQGLQVAGGHGSHTMGSVIGRFLAGAGLTLGGGYLLLDMGAQ